MDLIRTNVDGREEGFVSGANVDFEIGEADDAINDFEVEFRRQDWKGDLTEGCRLFSPDTEFGGIVKETATSSAAGTITVKGYTWRGMMVKKIISPASGQDYATATGEINSIIRQRVEVEFPGLFYGVQKSTGVTVNNYQFERYCTLHSGLMKMLKSVGYKLAIKYRQGEDLETGYVEVQAVPIVDYSEEYEFSNDNNMNFTSDENHRGVNHLICLGKGELKDRLVLHLYVDRNNNVGKTQYYTGKDEIAEIYDSNGSELSDLEKNGTEKLEGKKNKTEYNMTLESLVGEIDIGDIVGGRDYLTGIVMQKPIGRKIWTIAEGKEKIEYKLEGET
ncbi:hypothetical protein H9X90_02875 [Faecalicatena contorta]|uniref:Gp37-like protein n=1 Tax=Faecalicatena contorta TaxID=39482 RepID=UPI001960F278|nr:hypothetical protein [Faecalicatena contorta]MBM6686807.1 hypothetical protein [Faecalicatena contorta]MBM6709704.1 hypothetical protein [Faecalicatena contorta]